jgi:hypothetical protein
MMPGDLIHDDAGLERAIDRQVASFRHTISTERIYRHALSR